MEFDKHANSTGSRDVTCSLVAINLKSIIKAVATILQAQLVEVTILHSAFNKKKGSKTTESN